MKFLIVLAALSAVAVASQQREKRGLLGLDYGYSGLGHGALLSQPLAYGHSDLSYGLGHGYSSGLVAAPVIAKTYSAPIVAAPVITKAYSAPIISAPIYKSYAAPIISSPISYGHGLGYGYGHSAGLSLGYGYGKW